MSEKNIYQDLQQLGEQSALPNSPEEAILESVENPQSDVNYVVRFTAPEFTSRNHGAFHEDCTISIAKRIIEEIDPKWLRIGGYWYPRGGMPIDLFFAHGEIPKGVWVPDQGVPPYRGRG